MGYMHINNLYKDQRVLLFKECYVMEKVHGTSAHVTWKDNQLTFFSGGASYDEFRACFDRKDLEEKFASLGLPEVTVYGEAYGGKMQRMKDVYGDRLRFIAFDVKVGDSWLDVPNMADVALKLGLEVVPFFKTDTETATLDRHRDAPSIVASIRGCGHDKVREGIVIRPLIEVTTNNGERIMSKHKGAAFSERVHTPQVTSIKQEAETEAAAIAAEWVTEMRLSHVLDKLTPPATELKDIPRVIEAMVEDVYREAAGEIVQSQEASRAIKRVATTLFKRRITELKVA